VLAAYPLTDQAAPPTVGLIAIRGQSSLGPNAPALIPAIFFLVEMLVPIRLALGELVGPLPAVLKVWSAKEEHASAMR
jgi:hypothetical protein